MAVTMLVTKGRNEDGERNNERIKEDDDLPVVAAGSLFPYKISWLKMLQRSRKVEMIQLFPGHYYTVTWLQLPVVQGGVVAPWCNPPTLQPE